MQAGEKARVWYMCKKTSYKHIMQIKQANL